MEIFFYLLFPVLKSFSNDNEPGMYSLSSKHACPPYQLEAGEH